MPDTSLPYSPEAFVAREDEIVLVKRLANQILEGNPNRPHAVLFRGERGSGKSWLSTHLARTILPAISGVIPLLINLYAPAYTPSHTDNEYYAEVSPGIVDIDKALHAILMWLAQQLDTTTAQDASSRELASWLARDIERRYLGQVIVLILDSVLEADWDFLAKLETHLLAPLALLPRVLIIMTGRGPLYSWESPYLRVDVESRQLQPFDESTIQRQLDRQSLPAHLSPHEIHALGGGYPLVNRLLAQNSNTPEAMEQAVQALLSVIQPVHRYQLVRQYFEALCVLDGFREDEIKYMFAAYFGPSEGDWTTARVREARDECIRTNLMHWENGQFVIDHSLRIVLQNTLRLQMPNTRWRQLQEAAYQMYAIWANQYPRSQSYYQTKADQYARALG